MHRDIKAMKNTARYKLAEAMTKNISTLRKIAQKNLKIIRKN